MEYIQGQSFSVITTNSIFNEEGLDVVKDYYVINRSGLKDQNENNMKIASDNVEFENVELNIKWTKDDNGFQLINLEVKNK